MSFSLKHCCWRYIVTVYASGLFFVCISVCVKAACQNVPLGTNKGTLTLVQQ